jgi:UDPglucose--hexose-1-phosphate uridylyltransferase
MPEIRRNAITGEHVIMAPERGKRPGAAARPRPVERRAAMQEGCPFCPGNEAQTPESTFAWPEDGWRVRAFQNRFSVLSPQGEVVRSGDGLHDARSGVGLHEVICEARRHDEDLKDLAADQMAAVVRCWQERYRAFHADARIAFVSLFKNQGLAAGASLEHAHSQLVGLPLEPEQQQRRAESFRRAWSEAGACLLCRMLALEEAHGERVVHRTPGFTSFVPWAALSPFHLWLFPRRHRSSFASVPDAERDDFAAHLHHLLGRVDAAVPGADFNLVLQSSAPVGPAPGDEPPHLHWYLSIVPRVNRAAGLELGTAMYVNTALPEASAQALRGD